ncbi:hypothetical protein K3495_g11048 [Podosphaera aphanis]|nr:hypothetical protein K3495_g11048 [Podosphaera aphanis]
MIPSTFDPCLLHTTNDVLGLVGLQTDDTFILANSVFAAREEDQLMEAKFLAKEREKLTASNNLQFNRDLITSIINSIYLSQEKQCNNIRLIGNKEINIEGARGKIRKSATQKDQYIAQRACDAYSASMCQPEASFNLSFAAQCVNPMEDNAKLLNQRFKWQINKNKRGLKFVPLDINSLQLLVFTDASFAGNKDLSLQIGYVIVMTDKYKNANIIHWSSTKCKRITRSVLASELDAMVYGFNTSTTIKSTLSRILRTEKPILLVICTDSRSLYDFLFKLGTTREKRLMIDITSLRHSYERREITEVIWIDGNTNPADAMTKSKPCQALKILIQ